jgi:acyl carrier protein
MQPEELKSQIRSFVLANFYVADPAQVADGRSLLEQGIIDSTGVLEIISFVEATFGIAVEDEEMVPQNLDSIDGIARFVLRKQAAAVPALALASA